MRASLNLWLQRLNRALAFSFLAIAVSGCANVGVGADPLPSWSEGANKQAILAFVDKVTRDGSPDYVAPAKRIAAFDNDGTLWSEYPQYVQILFMFDQVKAAAPRHPEWAGNPVFKALMANDMQALSAAGDKPLLDLLAQANSAMTVEQYDTAVRQWLVTARHPTLNRPYTELVYQPQLELLDYLRSKGFKTFIVSGGSVEFMRPWSQAVYGIPPEEVVGSLQSLKFEQLNGQPVLMREPAFAFFNDGPEKPVGIEQHIGQRPILAFGNSDGDREMLEYVAAGTGPRLMLLVHHDDAAREFAYDRGAKVGALDKAWDEALRNNWLVVSMKSDWKQIFPDAKK